eukprot:Sspe_Gene.74191::Locus_45697_Transcript_1_1_Confidence_1.000_Length_4003::g.74191::m.74191/K05673/ABCC4; ATP-binding cassette, subfamily C (CFTR/MRP), member 4
MGRIREPYGTENDEPEVVLTLPPKARHSPPEARLEYDPPGRVKGKVHSVVATPAVAASPPRAKCLQPNPYTTAGIFSRESRWFLNDILKLGSQRPLQSDDLFEVDKDDDAEGLIKRVRVHWEREQGRANPSLLRALVKGFWKDYAVCGAIMVVQWGAGLLEPWWVSELLSFLGDKDREASEGWKYTALFMGCSLIRAVTFHLYFYRGWHMGMQCRVACTGLVHEKLLRLSTASLATTTTGHLVNLVSNDTERLDQSLPFLHFLWMALVKIGVALYVMWLKVGPSALAGMGLCLLLGPLQYAQGRIFGRLRTATASLTDRRVKIVNEVISGIRLVKMYTWEIPFSRAVAAVRNLETRHVRSANFLRALNLALYFSTTHIMMFVMLSIYVATGGTVTPDKVFVPLMYLSIVRLSVTFFVPSAVQNGMEALVSLRRMRDFLLLDEFEPVPVDTSLPPDQMVVLDRVTAFWPSSECDEGTPRSMRSSPTGSSAALDKVDLTVARGELVGIGGKVGGGKSSLVSVLTGELPCAAGKISLGSSPTIFSQEVWIMSGSVQSNILFGNEMDEERYQAVVEACCLEADFLQFSNGDQTVVGERGITLSGGQRARIGLARACYAGGDLFILDDPLSALDTIVGRHVFEHCICGLLAGTTRILVSHQHHFLADCGKTYYMSKGRLCEWEVECSTPSPNAAAAAKARAEMKKAAVQDEAPSQEVAEDRFEGAVSLATYMAYFRHGASAPLVVLLFLLFLAAQGAFAITDLWLARWADRSSDDKDNRFHMRWYIVLIVSLVGLAMARAVGFFTLALAASRSLHQSMFHRIIRCPVAFFDTNPSGRILNRFSKDVGQNDELLPAIFFDFLQITLICAGAVTVVAVVNPWVLVVVAPLVIFFLLLLRYYVQSAREIKRLEALHRSPLYSSFSEAIAGLRTIRAFRQTSYFAQWYRSVQNDHSSAFFLFLQVNRWLGLRLDMISWLFLAATTVALLLRRDSLSMGNAALSLAYVASLSGEFQWCVRQSAEVESYMTSVERLRAYTALPVEGGGDATAQQVPPSWPSAGAITLKGLSLRYRPGLPLVLKDITCHIDGGQKVGVVGRTGAGKSSLMQCIFRLVEPEDGAILIDGVNTSDIELATLRSAISAIPQDPVLFAGSLRYNLDPFSTCHDDSQLWNVLSAVQMREHIEGLEEGLDHEVSEGGRNFSVGQRQLICLARAILRKNRILVMDEATANVDPATDEIIQQTVRIHFRECTVLTIAHRLDTVIDCDRVMVLSHGSLAAFGHPHVLLQDPNCLFTKYVMETGPDAVLRLRDAALQKYLSSGGRVA